ncbi:hypothetical protein FGO68_gene9789 [Halteria grandinella]|uniref:Uncharacterized protein n=1 Tax=Halteria grandinella TaxID=5974 RepID=A0A8J8T5G6_HALGN|nr:hypothetical protein FGO68_gene9789 [Halteria grandinella]
MKYRLQSRQQETQLEVNLLTQIEQSILPSSSNLQVIAHALPQPLLLTVSNEQVPSERKVIASRSLTI